MKTQTNYIKILHLLILMLAYLAPVTAAAAVLPPDEATCTVRVNQGSVVFKISSSDPKNIISIQAKGTYVADCDQDALLRQTNDTNAFLVSLTHSGACVFIINNYDGTIFSVKIESATSTLTEVSIGGEPFTDCFSPSFVDLNLIGKERHDSNGAVKEECHANVEQEPIANNKNGKQQIDRNATAKDGQRDKIAQQPFRMSTRKTQRIM
ncbi:hypothetical protein MAR_017528 [Mya arenaria]|uniref:Uncharacterized protein n=1 Tax=Mya arenaria TaxID=6604 RepID=A0ABY7EES0_MYAAR|nr:hypothetical protein MAR_017528 [Mya arenaria]